MQGSGSLQLFPSSYPFLHSHQTLLNFPLQDHQSPLNKDEEMWLFADTGADRQSMSTISFHTHDQIYA